MESLKRLIRSDSGAAAVEFAIIVWALVFVCLGVVEFGRGLHLRNELSFAADRAARMILTQPAVSDSALETEVREAFIGPQPELLDASFGTEMAGGISFRTMLVQYPFSLLIPGFSDTITLTVSRRVPIG